VATTILLSELTAALVAELSKSAAEADRRQREAYIALAAEVAVPIEQVREHAAAQAQQFIEGELLLHPIEARPGGAAEKLAADVVVLDEAARQRIMQQLPETAALFEKTSLKEAPFQIRREALVGLAAARLRADAETRHREATTALRAGVPRTQIQGGVLTARIQLRQETNGAFTAKLAAEPAEAASTITVNFGMGAFPPPD